MRQHQTCDGASPAQGVRETPLTREAAWMVLAAVASAAYAAVLFEQLGGRLPYNDVYLGGDPLRILANLQSPESDFHRSPFHPLYGLACVMYQQAQAVLHLETEALLRAGVMLQAALLGGLAYCAVRVWGGGYYAAALAVLVIAGAAGFTHWAALPETHGWGGVTCLASLVLARFAPRLVSLRVANSALIYALSMSMVFTNVMIWLFMAPGLFLQGDLRDGRSRRVLADGAGLYVLSGLAGLGLVTLAFALQRRLLHDNPTLVDMFVFGHDRKYIFKGGLSQPLGGLNAIGVIAPSAPLASWLAPLLNAAVLIAIVWLSRNLPLRLRLAALFLLAAVAFHTVYARNEAFLCSPNYLGVWAVLLAVALSQLRRPRVMAGVAALAIAVGVYNFTDYRRLQTELGMGATFPMDAKPLPANSRDRVR